MDQLNKGTVLRDRYEISHVLGKGGFGITYQAYDRLVGVPVALKQYNTERMSDGREALEEAKIAAEFYNLEGIAAAKDYFEENENCYIVMDYIDGISVKRYVEEHGRMDGGEVLEKLRPILCSIGRIHERGVIHRDISADNLLITKDGKLQLIDFGAARFTEEYRDKTYTIIFKRGFAPVEQCHSHGLQGPWTDIYSLCATVYFMITGIIPDDAVERMIEDRVKPLSQIHGTGLSASAGAALMRGLAVKQEDRFQSVDELYEALYGATASEEVEPPTESTHTLWEGTTSVMREIHHYCVQKKKNLWKKWSWIVGGGIAAVLVLARMLYLVVGPVARFSRKSPPAAGMETTAGSPVSAPTLGTEVESGEPASPSAVGTEAESGNRGPDKGIYRIRDNTGMAERPQRRRWQKIRRRGRRSLSDENTADGSGQEE